MAIVVKSKKKSKGNIQRKLCVACIVSDVVVTAISEVYSQGLVENPVIDEIMMWCVEYHQKYGIAPKHNFQTVFESKIRKTKDDNKIENLTEILELCNREFERDFSNFNDKFYLDICLQYLRECRVQNTLTDVDALIQQDQVNEAEQLLLTYSKTENIADPSINPFTDVDEIFNAFNQSDQPILSFKGAIGNMLNDNCQRDNLIAFLGREKVGKTFVLVEFVFGGLKARLNTAFFGVGDMSKDQMTIRFSTRLAGKSHLAKYCQNILIPIKDCRKNQNDMCTNKRRTNDVCFSIDSEDFDSGDFRFEEAPPDYRACSNCNNCDPSVWFHSKHSVNPLTWREAFVNGQRFFKRMNGRDFKMHCTPNGTMSVCDIDQKLMEWEHTQGFVPDLVVIDYADILANEPNSPRDFRHQVNEKWKALRRLSQKWHCLVVTATQADAKSIDQILLNESNFSEDKRILAHVTGLYGLNKSLADKNKNIMRINEIVKREGSCFTNNFVTVLQSLETGRPFVDSF